MGTSTKSKPHGKSVQKKLPTFIKTLPYILIVCGLVGFIASAILTYDHNQIALNPHYVPSCNINPVVACGSVLRSKQTDVFHLPNPYIGLAVFPMVITTGVALLAGAKFKRWYWLALEAGTIFGIGFVHWLFFETVYRIHALCPYCMATWVITITSFWYLTLYNIQTGNIVIPKKLKPFINFLIRHHIDVLILWFLIIGALILKHFWYYYGKDF